MPSDSVPRRTPDEALGKSGAQLEPAAADGAPGCRSGLVADEGAAAAEVSERTCSKWVARYRAEGEAGLLDRCSAPRSIPHRTPEDRVETIAALTRLRMTGAEIALCLGMALSTVSAVLTRIGLGKRSRLEPPEPPNRYERRGADELLHVEVKKLGKISAAGHRVALDLQSPPTTRLAQPQAAHAHLNEPNNRAGSYS